MIKLSGDSAEAHLAAVWEKILSQPSLGQEIIHVLAEPAVFPEWIADFGPFQAWSRNQCEPSEEIWLSFAAIAESWPYIVNARRAAARGIPNTRILILRRDLQEPVPPWLRYLSEVHLPAISAMSGESLRRVRAGNCHVAGLPVRDCDVNLFGAAGVMLAGGDNGDVEWRAFLNRVDDPEPFREEFDFLVAMRDFAVAEGELAELPPQIRA